MSYGWKIYISGYIVSFILTPFLVVNFGKGTWTYFDFIVDFFASFMSWFWVIFAILSSKPWSDILSTVIWSAS